MSLRAELFMSAIAGLETALNNYLQLDPETFAQLEHFSGKVIAITIQGTGMTLYLLPHAGGINIMTEYAGEVDTTLSGTPLALAEMSLGEDATRVLFAGEVTISGDIELGQRFKRLLDQMDIDWEEHLSRFTGDIAAHKLADVGRSLQQWGQQALATLGLDLGEFLQQENRSLPVAEDINQFMSQVDVLRSDVDRLAARISRLQASLSATDSTTL